MTETRTPKQIAADKVAELIEKLEAAEGQDPTIDTEICLFFQYGGENSVGATNVRVEDDWDGDLLFEIDGDECCNPVPALTASLDAAVALAERVLPGVEYEATNLYSHYRVTFHHDDGPFYGDSPISMPLALCLAILKAVRAHMHPRDREEATNG